MSATIDSPAANPRLTREEAAEYVSASAATLATWATRGTGPHYLKVGRSVRYLRSDLDEWLASRRVTCTAELNDALRAEGPL